MNTFVPPVGAGLSRSACPDAIGEDSDLSEPALGPDRSGFINLSESRLPALGLSESRCIGDVSGFQPHRCRFIEHLPIYRDPRNGTRQVGIWSVPLILRSTIILRQGKLLWIPISLRIHSYAGTNSSGIASGQTERDLHAFLT